MITPLRLMPATCFKPSRHSVKRSIGPKGRDIGRLWLGCGTPTKAILIIGARLNRRERLKAGFAPASNPPHALKGRYMSLYKYGAYLQQSQDASFDAVHRPGAVPPHSGIYRCPGCGREVVAEEGRQLPPQNHHQHTLQQGDVRWQMIVYADHRAK